VIALVAARQLVIPGRKAVEGPRARPPHTKATVARHTPPRAAALPESAILLNPRQVDFGKQDVNTMGPVHTIHVVNVSPAPLRVIDITTKGNAARDYAGSNTCVGATIGAYTGCTISVRFTPTARGMRTANMVILDNSAYGPQHVVLTGNGR
jgi:hypothetical protein